VKIRLPLLAVSLAFAIAGCGGGNTEPTSHGSARTAQVSTPANPQRSVPGQPTATPIPHQSPVAPEVNPPGDIPDNTQFVPYTSKDGGFTVTVPEGWSRRTHNSSVSFSDKLNTITLSWVSAAKPPSLRSAKASDIPQLSSSELAFRLQSVKTVTLPAGKGVMIDY
jgi:hypothetical protein